ncbi:unnamed protein product, partial [Arabidopsis halleri]
EAVLDQVLDLGARLHHDQSKKPQRRKLYSTTATRLHEVECIFKPS